jgi:hypothetical protein
MATSQFGEHQRALSTVDTEILGGELSRARFAEYGGLLVAAAGLYYDLSQGAHEWHTLHMAPNSVLLAHSWSGVGPGGQPDMPPTYRGGVTYNLERTPEIALFTVPRPNDLSEEELSQIASDKLAVLTGKQFHRPPFRGAVTREVAGITAAQQPFEDWRLNAAITQAMNQ